MRNYTLLLHGLDARSRDNGARATPRLRSWAAARVFALEQMIAHLVAVDISRDPVLRADARLDAGLTRAGTRMGQQNGLWLAATAAASGAVLVTTDRDVDVLHPASIQREWLDPQSLR